MFEMFEDADRTANAAGRGCQINVRDSHGWFELVLAAVLAVKFRFFMLFRGSQVVVAINARCGGWIPVKSQPVISMPFCCQFLWHRRVD